MIDRVALEDDTVVRAHLAIDDVRLMFQGRDSLEEELPAMTGTSIGGPFTLYVDVDDVEALSERLAGTATAPDADRLLRAARVRRRGSQRLRPLVRRRRRRIAEGVDEYPTSYSSSRSRIDRSSAISSA